MKSIKVLIEEISQIPLHEVVASRVELRKFGREWKGICPNPEHDDHGIGNFSVNSDKSIAKCFACGYAFNNGISFISKFDKVSRLEAILRISLMAGLITQDDYNRCSKEKYIGDNSYLLKPDTNYQKASDGDLASVETRNLVYKILVDGKKLEGEADRLTKEHREYLHSRGISDEEIEKYKYFSMPTRRAMPKIKKKLSLFGDANEILANVPGFYRDKEKKYFTLYPVKGIGIPIRDSKGRILAIQIRKDKVEEGGQRYSWWSTGFASDSYGASPGAPLDIVIPDEIKYKSIFITEGHFKAAVIAKTFFSPTISVQGVGNWKQIKESINSLRADTKYIFIAYDADMAHNAMVMKQAIKMAIEVKKLFPELIIFFVIWNEDYGKGIDDLILAGHKDKLHRMSLEKFGGIWCSYKSAVDKDPERKKELFMEFFLNPKD